MGVGRERVKQQQPKLGAGAGKAFLRQGLKELSQVIPATKDSIQVVEEPGAIGNLTPQEVVSQKTGKELEPEMA